MRCTCCPFELVCQKGEPVPVTSNETGISVTFSRLTSRSCDIAIFRIETTEITS